MQGPSWDREIAALLSDFILLFCQLLTSVFSLPLLVSLSLSLYFTQLSSAVSLVSPSV